VLLILWLKPPLSFQKSDYIENKGFFFFLLAMIKIFLLLD